MVAQEVPAADASITIDRRSNPRASCADRRAAKPFESNQTLVNCASPSTILYPTGCCIHEFATRMKYPDAQLPNTTIQSVARCNRGESRFQPDHSPRNVDSNITPPTSSQEAPQDVAVEPR
jgi:hypothetical protein